MAEQKIPYVRPDGSSPAREVAAAILYLLNLSLKMQQEIEALTARIQALEDAGP
jgi:hypothetical protein